MYLWHFPVIILLAALILDGTWTYYLTAVVLFGLLAVFSFHLIEDPVSRSAWLKPGRDRRTPSKTKREDRVENRRRMKTPALALVSCITTGLVVLSLWPGPAEEVVQVAAARVASAPTIASAPALDPAASEVQSVLSAQIDTALKETDWPNLQPSIDEVLSPEREHAPCVNGESHACVSNVAAPKTALVIGGFDGQDLRVHCQRSPVGYLQRFPAVIFQLSVSARPERVQLRGAAGCVPGGEAGKPRQDRVGKAGCCIPDEQLYSLVLRRSRRRCRCRVARCPRGRAPANQGEYAEGDCGEPPAPTQKFR